MTLRKRPPRRKDHHRRQRVKRIKPTGAASSRVFRIYPDPGMPHHVAVRLSPTHAHMLAAIKWIDGVEEDPRVAGMCRTWHSIRLRQAGVSRPGLLIARIYLNVRDLRERPGEIIAHECGHAAMGWARFRRANLRRMPGEEVMCHALGRLVAQCNHHLYALGVFA